MNLEEKKALQLLALRGREHIIRSTHAAGSGHPGGSLSAIDYLVYLYEKVLVKDPSDPKMEKRDRFVLSKGHVAPALYSVLAMEGYFPEEDLVTLRKPDSHLQGHPNMNDTPGVDFSTGSLGQGVSGAAGMAKAAKYLGTNQSVYTLLGDGEIAEGIVWEAIAWAAHYELDNLCIAVDVNGLQIDGATKDVLNMEPMDSKFEAFGCKVVKADGHDFDSLEAAFDAFKNNAGSGKPMVILLKTVKGKGVSFMENQAGWHGKAPNDEQMKAALEELSAARAVIEEV